MRFDTRRMVALLLIPMFAMGCGCGEEQQRDVAYARAQLLRDEATRFMDSLRCIRKYCRKCTPYQDPSVNAAYRSGATPPRGYRWVEKYGFCAACYDTWQYRVERILYPRDEEHALRWIREVNLFLPHSIAYSSVSVQDRADLKRLTLWFEKRAELRAIEAYRIPESLSEFELINLIDD